MSSGDFDLTLIGDAEVIRAVNRLEKKVAGRLVKKGVTEAGKVALEAIRANTPVDTGRLRDTLYLKRSTGRRGLLGVRVMTGRRRDLGIPEDAEFYYPAVVEYKQQSFLRATLDANASRLIGIIRGAIRSGLGGI